MPQLNSIYFYCHSEPPFFVGEKNLASARKFIKIRSFAKFTLSEANVLRMTFIVAWQCSQNNLNMYDIVLRHYM